MISDVRFSPSFRQPQSVARLAGMSLLLVLGGCSNPAPSNDQGSVTVGVKSDLQLHLKFDEPSISAGPLDSSSHAIVVTFGAAKPAVNAHPAPGLLPSNPAALTFDGIATVEIPPSENLSWGADESYTIALWANVATLPTAPNWSAVISNNPGNGSSYCGIYISDKGTWSFESNGIGEPNPVVRGGAPIVGKWQHVAIVQNATTLSQMIYVDGVSGGLVTREPHSCISRSGFSIGFKDGDGFIGAVDDVRIYGSALTEAQVKELYSGVETITP